MSVNRYSIVAVLLVALCSGTGCSTVSAYKDAQAAGEDKSFVGWLFTPRTEMSDEELDRAESLKDGGYTSNRGRLAYGAGGGSRFQERYSHRRRNGEAERSYSYRYDASVGAGVDIDIRYSPRPREYTYDKEQRKRIREREERSRRQD